MTPVFVLGLALGAVLEISGTDQQIKFTDAGNNVLSTIEQDGGLSFYTGSALQLRMNVTASGGVEISGNLAANDIVVNGMSFQALVSRVVALEQLVPSEPPSSPPSAPAGPQYVLYSGCDSQGKTGWDATGAGNCDGTNAQPWNGRKCWHAGGATVTTATSTQTTWQGCADACTALTSYACEYFAYYANFAANGAPGECRLCTPTWQSSNTYYLVGIYKANLTTAETVARYTYASWNAQHSTDNRRCSANFAASADDARAAAYTSLYSPGAGFDEKECHSYCIDYVTGVSSPASLPFSLGDVYDAASGSGPDCFCCDIQPIEAIYVAGGTILLPQLA